MAIRITTNVSAQNVVGWVSLSQAGLDKALDKVDFWLKEKSFAVCTVAILMMQTLTLRK